MARRIEQAIAPTRARGWDAITNVGANTVRVNADNLILRPELIGEGLNNFGDTVDLATWGFQRPVYHAIVPYGNNGPRPTVAITATNRDAPHNAPAFIHALQRHPAGFVMDNVRVLISNQNDGMDGFEAVVPNFVREVYDSWTQIRGGELRDRWNSVRVWIRVLIWGYEGRRIVPRGTAFFELNPNIDDPHANERNVDEITGRIENLFNMFNDEDYNDPRDWVLPNITTMSITYFWSNGNLPVVIGGKRKNGIPALHIRDLYRKNCVGKVADDTYCVLRCFIAQYYLEHMDLPEAHRYLVPTSIKARLIANRLMSDLRIPYVDGQGVVFPDGIEILAKYFAKKCVVFDARTLNDPERVVYVSQNDNYADGDTWYFLIDDCHMAYIKDVCVFFNTNFFCEHCLKGFNQHLYKHQCKPTVCTYCRTEHPNLSAYVNDKNIASVFCYNCMRTCYSKTCYDKHLSLGVCKTSYYCATCQREYPRDLVPMLDHVCGQKYCFRCAIQVPVNPPHMCPIKSLKLKRTTNKYVVFDVETTQDNGIHVPVYIEAAYISHTDDIKNSVVFQDEKMPGDCLKSFAEWVFSPIHHGYTFLAHNGKGFDFQFVLKMALATGRKPYVVNTGMKLLCIQFKGKPKIRFIDTLSFLQMPLRKFSSTFGIKELKKGFFPHYFHTHKNRNYVGPWPDLSHYACEDMSTELANECRAWYADQKDKIFDMQKELREYCHSDVMLLKHGAIQLKQCFEKASQIDPFQSITIAATAMKIFRTLHLQDDKIYTMRMMHSEFIRRGFYGGRTEAYKLLYKFENGVTGHYMDICSLYPTVQYFDPYPIGQCSWWVNGRDYQFDEDFDWLNEYGFAEIDYTPPTNLYHPVLPFHNPESKKLVFDLVPRDHQVHFTLEIRKAVEKGYTIRRVHRMIYWKETSTTLFNSYIKCFLRIKLENSGWPSECKDAESKQAYITKVQDQLDIKLDPEIICKNPGMKTTSKLLLNSLWGKFCERWKRTHVEYTGSYEDTCRIFFNEHMAVKSVDMISDKFAEISYTMTEDSQAAIPKGTIHLGIGAATTALARLRLYEQLEKLDQQVLYCDTDSIIYYHDPTNLDHKHIPQGNSLGEWESELDDTLEDLFISGGPKNYAYKERGKDWVVKIKGIILTEANARLFTAENMKSVILNPEDSTIQSAEMFHIDRVKSTKDLITRMLSKYYGYTYSKRQPLKISDNYIDSFPFNYKYT